MSTTIKPPVGFSNDGSSLLSDIQTPLKLLLKGPSGSGKTTKAAQFPRPAIFTFDNNLASLRKLPVEVRSKIKIFDPTIDDEGKQVKGEKVFERFVILLERVMNRDDIDTIVIDSLSTMSNVVENTILKSTKVDAAMQIQDWGTFTRYIGWIMETCCTNNALKKHVIFTAHESNVYGKPSAIGAPAEVIRIELLLPTKVKEKVELYFTDVWRTEVRSTPVASKYYINTRSSSMASAKCSLPIIGTKEIPDSFDWDLCSSKVLATINDILKDERSTSN